jgi:hypothetical protein
LAAQLKHQCRNTAPQPLGDFYRFVQVSLGQYDQKFFTAIAGDPIALGT